MEPAIDLSVSVQKLTTQELTFAFPNEFAYGKDMCVEIFKIRLDFYADLQPVGKMVLRSCFTKAIGIGIGNNVATLWSNSQRFSTRFPC